MAYEVPVNRSQKLPGLIEVADALDRRKAFADYAEDLRLVGRIITKDHQTGLEPLVRHGVAFADAVGSPHAPIEFREYTHYLTYKARQSTLRAHMDMLKVDEARTNDFLEDNERLIMAVNKTARCPYLTISGVIIEDGNDQTDFGRLEAVPASLTAVSGNRLLGTIPGKLIVCDPDRLPDGDMRDLVAEATQG